MYWFHNLAQTKHAKQRNKRFGWLAYIAKRGKVAGKLVPWRERERDENTRKQKGSDVRERGVIVYPVQLLR